MAAGHSTEMVPTYQVTWVLAQNIMMYVRNYFKIPQEQLLHQSQCRGANQYNLAFGSYVTSAQQNTLISQSHQEDINTPSIHLYHRITAAVYKLFTFSTNPPFTPSQTIQNVHNWHCINLSNGDIKTNIQITTLYIVFHATANLSHHGFYGNKNGGGLMNTGVPKAS